MTQGFLGRDSAPGWSRGVGRGRERERWGRQESESERQKESGKPREPGLGILTFAQCSAGCGEVMAGEPARQAFLSPALPPA